MNKDKQQRRYEVNKFLLRLIDNAMEDIKHRSSCPYQQQNNQGRSYCAALCFFEDDNDRFNEIRKRCQYLGDQREVPLALEFGETPFGYFRDGGRRSRKLLKLLEGAKSEFGKKVRDRILGDPELNMRLSEEFFCYYEINP